MKYRISFVPHAKAGSDVKYLECRLKWDSCRKVVSFATGYRIDPDKWVSESQRCRPNSFHGPSKVPAAEINEEIERYTRAARDVFAELGPSPDRDEVSRRVRMKLGLRSAPGTPGTRQAFNLFLSEQSSMKGWSSGTETKMRVVGKHLDDSGLFPTFSQFTEQNLRKYLIFLREDLDLTDVTVHRQIGYLRWFLGWAAGKGWLTLQDWQTFSPKLHTPDQPVIFLEWDELMAVWNFHDPKRPWLDGVRDIFCFCAFSSLRYSDAYALTWADVGEDAIRITTKKTREALTIELNKWSREVLGRYDRPDASMKVFPRITNQVMNRALKEICKSCGIDAPVRRTRYKGGERIDETFAKWQLVGSHAARRTFICNALQLGVSPTTVMQWTGHASYDSMKPYIAVANAARAQAMKGFDRLGKKKTGRRK